MDIKIENEKTIAVYYDARTCQNSNEKYICQLKDDGVELPISKSGECRIQFCRSGECDNFF